MSSPRADLFWTWLPRLLVAAGVVVLGVALVGVLTDDDDPPAADRRAQPAEDDDPPPLTAAPTESLPPVSGPLAEGRTAIPGFGEVEIRVVEGPDGEDVVLCVLLAETPDQRRQGLMQVSDEALGGYDGMLFTFPTDDEGGFWMKDTLLPALDRLPRRRGGGGVDLGHGPVPGRAPRPARPTRPRARTAWPSRCPRAAWTTSGWARGRRPGWRSGAPARPPPDPSRPPFAAGDADAWPARRPRCDRPVNSVAPTVRGRSGPLVTLGGRG